MTYGAPMQACFAGSKRGLRLPPLWPVLRLWKLMPPLVLLCAHAGTRAQFEVKASELRSAFLAEVAQINDAEAAWRRPGPVCKPSRPDLIDSNLTIRNWPMCRLHEHLPEIRIRNRVAMSDDEAVDTLLQVIVELDYFDANVIRAFDRRPLRERKIVASRPDDSAGSAADDRLWPPRQDCGAPHQEEPMTTKATLTEARDILDDAVNLANLIVHRLARKATMR
jgi:hypothetical protein